MKLLQAQAKRFLVTGGGAAIGRLLCHTIHRSVLCWAVNTMFLH